MGILNVRLYIAIFIVMSIQFFSFGNCYKWIKRGLTPKFYFLEKSDDNSALFYIFIFDKLGETNYKKLNEIQIQFENNQEKIIISDSIVIEQKNDRFYLKFASNKRFNPLNQCERRELIEIKNLSFLEQSRYKDIAEIERKYPKNKEIIYRYQDKLQPLRYMVHETNHNEFITKYNEIKSKFWVENGL